MKHLGFKLIFPLIFSLAMIWGESCHGMFVWDGKTYKKITVDEFFAKSAESGEGFYAKWVKRSTWSTNQGRLARPEFVKPGIFRQQSISEGIDAFWIPERLEPNSETKKDEYDPCFGLRGFLQWAFENHTEPLYNSRQLMPRIEFESYNEQIEFGNRLYTKICQVCDNRPAKDFSDDEKRELRGILNNYQSNFGPLIRPLPDEFYKDSTRDLTAIMFFLSLGAVLIAHQYRKTVLDVCRFKNKIKKRYRKQCRAIMALGGAIATAAALAFCFSYFEIGSFRRKVSFKIPNP